MDPVYLRKYATTLDATTAGSVKVRASIRKAGSADFAAGGDWTPATGDVKVSIDGGSQANIGTLPAYSNGAWEFVLSNTELTGKSVKVTTVDSATKAVDDDAFVVETFGHASAMYPTLYSGGSAAGVFTTSDTAPADVTKWNGTSIPGVDTAGYPKVTIKSGTGTGEASLASGVIQSDAAKVGGTTQTGTDLATAIGGVQSTASATQAIVSNGTYGNQALLAAINANLTAINNINNLSALANIYGPPILEIPDSSSTLYPFTLIVRDSEGHLADLDSSPTLAAINAAGTDRSANLSAVTHAATGRYTFTYSVASNATEEGLRISATGAVSSSARYVEIIVAVANYDSITTLAAIKAKTDNLPADPASEANATSNKNSIITKLSDGTITLNAAYDAAKTAASATAVAAITAVLSGITSLKQWLGMLAGKQAGDSTALAEIRATGAGSGTFNPTTDSGEALRDRGDAAWTTGTGGGGGGLSGASTVTLTFEDADGNPVPYVEFTVASQGSDRADSAGVATFSLNDGSYTVNAAPVAGTLFAPYDLTVSGSTNATVTGTAVTITTPSNPGDCTAYVQCYDTHNTAKVGAIITFRMIKAPSGASYNGDEFTATSGSDGMLSVTLAKGGTYEATRGTGKTYQVKVGTASTQALDPILGVDA
jgi:hypothetical protein